MICMHSGVDDPSTISPELAVDGGPAFDQTIQRASFSASGSEAVFRTTSFAKAFTIVLVDRIACLGKPD